MPYNTNNTTTNTNTSPTSTSPSTTTNLTNHVFTVYFRSVAMECAGTPVPGLKNAAPTPSVFRLITFPPVNVRMGTR